MINEFGHGYGPRTSFNARNSDLTIAFAVDYTSAGEVLTKREAGKSYIAVPLVKPQDFMEQSRIIYKFLRDNKLVSPTINIAGNSLRTLKKAGWDQTAVTFHIAVILTTVHRNWPIGKIISGGQTGADIGGIIAAYMLGIPYDINMPVGFLQRDVTGTDSKHTIEEIEKQIVDGAYDANHYFDSSRDV